MADFGKLISGFRVFKATVYPEKKEILTHMIRQGIKSKTLFISCSDLRLSPDVIFSCNPGELYVCRNVGALIPEYTKKTASGIIATIEYGVNILEVENIVVMGHTNCDGIKLLMSEDFSENSENEESNSRKTHAMRDWLSIAAEAKAAVKKELKGKSEEEQEVACQHESILVSLKHLLTYPFVEDRIQAGKLNIYGWHLDMESGVLLGFDPETKFFDPIG